MILSEEGGRLVFEKFKEDHNVICAVEEIDGIKEMDTRPEHREYTKSRVGKPIQEPKTSIFDTLECADSELLRLCRSLSSQKFVSEPVKPIHTAIRIVFHASILLGRPYDVNMMASVLSIQNTVVVQQALKKWYEGLSSQSELREEHFVSTYLWVLGLPQRGHARDLIVNAINTYGDVYDGRSVFSIARDYVIIYFRVFLKLPFTCIPTDRIGIPPNFLDLVTKFETRAKISKRKIFIRFP